MVDIRDDKEGIPEQIIGTSLLFIFFHKEGNRKLLGIYDINEINNINDLEKIAYKPNEEYRIFFNFFKVMVNKNINNEEKTNYLLLFEKYKNNIEIENIVKNLDIDFSNINYENYIIYINICLFYYYNKTLKKEGLLEEFEEKFNLLIKCNLAYSDRIRIMRFTCREFVRISDEKRVIHLIFLDKLLENNAYKIAINFNKNIINNLEEISKLYIPFLQLDSYILYNYKIKSDSYTLSLEPLNITKKHLLSSYDDFIFTCKEKSYKNDNKVTITLASQSVKDDVTVINEYGLFSANDNCDSKVLYGNDDAVPISTNLLHERNGHSKKAKKNRRNLTPPYFYKKKKIVKVNGNYKEIDKVSNTIKGEAGRLVEYFIRYKKNSLIPELIANRSLGNIINNVKLFTSKNFKDLAIEIDNKKIKKNFSIIDFLQKGFFNKNTIQLNAPANEDSVETENDPPKESLEYYEKNYLLNGKIFVYPYSIPVDYISADEKEKDISEGRRRYLEKYKDNIIEGRKRHYGQDYNN